LYFNAEIPAILGLAKEAKSASRPRTLIRGAAPVEDVSAVCDSAYQA
jgi:hypothetical protein